MERVWWCSMKGFNEFLDESSRRNYSSTKQIETEMFRLIKNIQRVINRDDSLSEDQKEYQLSVVKMIYLVFQMNRQ